jgi:chromosome segregation ATPase
VRTCVWCDKPLPEPSQKGHRRREFCDDRCKQQHYLWHKQMKRDATSLAEPYWRDAYKALVDQYRWLEDRLQERLADLDKKNREIDELEKRVQYWQDHYEALVANHALQLKALGISEQDIHEFEAYWQAHTKGY